VGRDTPLNSRIRVHSVPYKEFTQRKGWGAMAIQQSGSLKRKISEKGDKFTHSVEVSISPADAVVLSVLAFAGHDPYEINQILVFAKARGDLPKFGIVISDYNRLRMFEDGIYVVHHESRNVGNAVQNEVSIRAHKFCHLHILVIDTQIVTFADETLNHLDDWALAQIVGPSLKAESQNANLFMTSLHDEL
jgi:hypothetical protein